MKGMNIVNSFIFKTFARIIWLSFAFSIIGCVGTVEEGKNTQAFTTKESSSDIEFSGVQEATEISDSRVEVFFRPATGASGLYNYKINLGGGFVPISVPSEVLGTDYRGYLKFTLKNLNPGYLYKISIDVEDQSGKSFTKTERIEEAKTFTNSACNFDGISAVENLPGTAGVDSLRIKWTHAEVLSDGFQKIHPGDPYEYEITLLDSALYTPADFPKIGLNGNVGRFTAISQYDPVVQEFLFRGLPSGSSFYVKVRCFNSNNRPNDAAKPWLDGEMNTNYIKAGTLNNELSSITFDPDLIILSQGVGSEASKTFSVDWGEVQGVFDHYRLYYSTSTISKVADCAINQPIANVFCKKIAYNEDRVQVFPLLENTKYNVELVICQDFACSTGKRLTAKTWEYDTSIPVAQFFGINSIEEASILEELGQLKIIFTRPSLANGIFDGFVVRYKAGSELAPEIEITDPGTYNGTMEVLPHDHLNVDWLVLDQVVYGITHCFNVSLFKWKPDGSGDKDYTYNEVWRCIEPQIIAPSKADFVGIDESEAISSSVSSKILLQWKAPGKGVYEKFEIYLLHNDAISFNFNDAVAETSTGDTSNYMKYVVDRSTLDLEIGFVTPGKRFVVGVVTYFVSNGSEYRSVFNDNIITCNVAALVASGDNDAVVACGL